MGKMYRGELYLKFEGKNIISLKNIKYSDIVSSDKVCCKKLDQLGYLIDFKRIKAIN